MGSPMDDADAEMFEGLLRSRQYAGFFDWPDRDLAEYGVVESLAKALEKHGALFFSDLKIRGRGSDPPDLEAVDADGQRVAIEVTELVDGEAIHAHKIGRTSEIAEWGRQPFLDRVGQLLAKKEASSQRLMGGPYPGGYVVVLHTDETFLTHPAVDEYLKGQTFTGLPSINRAFLLLSYTPGKGYPYFELNIQRA